ncbi:MAG: ParB/RepB/Spo0J family partition protein [Lachnospiraceae bacterium]
MQPTAEQIRWVPLSDIQETNRAESSAKAGAIQVEAEADGRYTLVAGQEHLQRLREEGSCYVAAVISPGVPLEERLSAFVDRLAKGRLHYLDEAEQYRSFIRQDGLTTQQLSQRTGRSVQTVRRKIRLLNLGEEVCALLRHL